MLTGGRIGVLDHRPKELRRDIARAHERDRAKAFEASARVDAAQSSRQIARHVLRDVKARDLVLGELLILVEQRVDRGRVLLWLFEELREIDEQLSKTHGCV